MRTSTILPSPIQVSPGYRDQPQRSREDHGRAAEGCPPVNWKSRDSPSASQGSFSSARVQLWPDIKGWNPVEQTGFYVYIAAFTPTDQSSSTEPFQTNRHEQLQELDSAIIPSDFNTAERLQRLSSSHAPLTLAN
jgi:hypothetical protein